jgi:hypothetical protein
MMHLRIKPAWWWKQSMRCMLMRLVRCAYAWLGVCLFIEAWQQLHCLCQPASQPLAARLAQLLRQGYHCMLRAAAAAAAEKHCIAVIMLVIMQQTWGCATSSLWGHPQQVAGRRMSIAVVARMLASSSSNYQNACVLLLLLWKLLLQKLWQILLETQMMMLVTQMIWDTLCQRLSQSEGPEFVALLLVAGLRLAH